LLSEIPFDDAVDVGTACAARFGILGALNYESVVSLTHLTNILSLYVLYCIGSPALVIDETD
jgi:hypothetical protein